MIKIAINGFGRIGRAFFRLAYKEKDITIVAINDLGDPDNLAYLLKRDSVYGTAPFSVDLHNDELVVDGKTIPLLSEKDPAQLPWKDMDVDIVVESTGFFTTFEKSKAHIDAGAKRVVISAPAKDTDAGVPGETILMGVNEEKLKTCNISSNASCTTNAGTPLIAILDESIGIEKAVLNTVHGYTASQSLVDGPSKKDLRGGRAAAQNIIPTTTGAAIATTKAYTSLAGQFDGVAMRVPVIVGSIVDITFIAKRDTTVEEVNEILTKAASQKRWESVFAVTTEPIVSSDIIGDTHGAIADLSFTRVVGGNLVKVFAWYDNETGYSNMLLKHVLEAGKHL
ncbi:type I glyceraldehyde-3-phosphate dehydrogenase [Candidatus Kaiserbacteria bacterium CG10_big_fil_rev_8_21_14_0_10_45_20]|uniref:Type I glyceraldehyde-3-phosphate dehydrogenase n=1 Tax=Candidatus Kaiserbacteria bacterium CG10_big_fil_rev_8_21_14_0_10_45_20 TaxID=1974607 RepID=A0A2H0UEX3_9BACT|nr:MAG: type I glyceraldehyde-3-phosphate dehydrogenase [Candidatus Kaiserbacteria bacterium CG10_big_fil_rev_8_21_14_0_10_45_20]